MNLSFARNFYAIVLVVTQFLLQSPGIASELSVPKGCDAPSPSSGGRIFYIDPVRGSMQNDGSEARPWRSLAEVVDPANHLISTRVYVNFSKSPQDLQPVNPGGPIKPGDTLVLMNGDHGAVEIRQYQNDNFIYVVAGAKQTPLIRNMRILSASHWYFNGLKFQDLRPEKNPYTGLVEVSENDLFGPGNDVIFVSNSFSTQDNVSEWTDADWVNKPFDYGIRIRTRCSTVSGNHFFNLRNAAAIAGDNSLVADNLVEYAGNDGFDIMASNLTVSHNIVKNGHHTLAESLHADGIQGWTLNDATNSNVIIDGNILIDTNQSADNYMQGISIFDGKWDGLKVINNVIITNTWHGIALYGVDNVDVINNTVVPSRAEKYMTWINIHAAKDKRPSSNVVVRNNIAGKIAASGVNVAVDHNLSLSSISQRAKPDGVAVSDGAVFSHNLVGVPFYSLFSKFDMTVPAYDLHLAPKSFAREAGSSEGAPSWDIEGRPRVPPIDIGAYAR